MIRVGIAATMRKGSVDLPIPEFVAYCKEAGADVMELSGRPMSHAQTLVLDDEGVERVRTLTRRAGRRLRMRDVSPPSLSIPLSPSLWNSFERL